MKPKYTLVKLEKSKLDGKISFNKITKNLLFLSQLRKQLRSTTLLQDH